MENSILNEEILTAKDISEYLHISLSQAYNLLNSNDFPTLHIGNRKLITATNLNKWIINNTNSVEYN